MTKEFSSVIEEANGLVCQSNQQIKFDEITRIVTLHDISTDELLEALVLHGWNDTKGETIYQLRTLDYRSVTFVSDGLALHTAFQNASVLRKTSQVN